MNGRIALLGVTLVVGVGAFVLGTRRADRSEPNATATALPAPALGPRAEDTDVVPGSVLADFAWTALDGRSGSLESLLENRRAVVLVMRTSECPVARKYGHRQARLARRYDSLGVGFAYLNASPQDTPEKMAGDVDLFAFRDPYIVDGDGSIARSLDARVSSELWVIDASRTVVYRGALDDQFGIDFAKPRPRATYLTDALDAMLADQPVAVPLTRASGCFLVPHTHDEADEHG